MKFLKGRAYPNANTFKNQVKNTMKEVVEVYYSNLKELETMLANQKILIAFMDSLTFDTFKRRYKKEKKDFIKNLAKDMKKAIKNDDSYKDISSIVKNVIKNAKWPKKKDDFEKIHNKLKKFLKNYSALLKKLLQLEWAQEAIEFRLKDLNVTQVKNYDSLDFTNKFPDDMKWFLQDIKGKEEADEVHKTVKDNLPKNKPQKANELKDMKKTLRPKLEKYFKDELTETKKDFQRARIESFLKNNNYDQFSKVFSEKSSFKNDWEGVMKRITLNDFLDEALEDKDFEKMLEKVNYPEKDTFKGEVDKITKN